MGVAYKDATTVSCNSSWLFKEEKVSIARVVSAKRTETDSVTVSKLNFMVSLKAYEVT